jgi:outer membrane protein assembly factor BamB
MGLREHSVAHAFLRAASPFVATFEIGARMSAGKPTRHAKACGTILLCSAIAFAAEWPQWRGPNRDGAITSQLPADLPQKLVKAWSARVGEGHSSPVLSGGKLYVFAREKDDEVLYAIDPANGKTVWRQSYPAPYKVNYAAAAHGPGPKSTPVAQDGRIVTFGISGVLSAWDAASGRLLWRKEFSKEFKSTSPLYGTASSPVIDRGLVIANVGGNDSGSLAAFDLKSGALKWNCTGDGPGYSSPIIVELAGVRQAVTQTQKNIIGVRIENGEMLWRIPYTTDYVQNIVTPLSYKDTLILAGLNNPTFAIRIVKSGAGFKTEKLWESPQTPMYMSSPVLAGDLLFGFTHKNKGQLFCQDPRTGKVLWSGPPRQGDNASLTVSGSTLFEMKDDAEMIVAKASGGGYEPVRHYRLADSSVWAHPVITDTGVIVKDAASVTFWSWK